MMDVTHTTIRDGGFTEEDRSRFQRMFLARLLAEEKLRGRVLDIGCGGHLPQGLEQLQGTVGHLDGVDPSPEVAQHPLLRQRWQATFETSGVPSGAYDLAYAYNVVEHVPQPLPFFKRLREVLRPDGVFWALTPHARHPFTLSVRLVQAMKLKHSIASRNSAVNDYPAYYRLNSASVVTRAAEACGFRSAEFVYLPNVNWDTYFPSWARVVPHLYDRLFGLRFPSRMLLLAYRLQ